MEEQYKGKATASMVLGIVSLVFMLGSGAIVPGIIGLACGIIGLVLSIQVKKGYEAAGLKAPATATAGFVTSIIGVIGCAVWIVSCLACVACSTAAYTSIDPSWHHGNWNSHWMWN